MRTLVLVSLLSLGLPLLAGNVPSAHAAKKEKKKEAAKEGIITWKVGPADVVIYVDGKKVGTADKAMPFKAKAGMHMIRLTWGKDEVEEPINVNASESVEFQYTFEDSGKPAP
jgi:hypothetical protein